MIETWYLSAFPINYNQDFAIIGDGPSQHNFKYHPGIIKIFAINRAFLSLLESHAGCKINVVTMYPHHDYIEGLLEQQEQQDFHLITIQLFDIRMRQLPSGDTANMLVHYLVHKMKEHGVRDKKIYLTGFDFSYQKDWKPQIESLKYCQVAAEYNNIDIICTSENKRLDFLKHESPEPRFLK